MSNHKIAGDGDLPSRPEPPSAPRGHRGDLRITEVQRMKIKPGDRLIAYTDRAVVSEEEAHQMAQRLRLALQMPDLPIVIATREWEFVIAAGPPTRHDAARGVS